MRWVEITSGARIPVSAEEQNVIDAVKKDALDPKDERQQEVVRKLVSRGILNRKKSDDEVSYSFAKSSITRF